MNVAVDFIQGSNGAYLEFVCNTFLIPTMEFSDPFTVDGTSHNKLYNPDICKFHCGHYYLYDNFAGFTHVIIIEVCDDDIPRLRKIKNLKFGDCLGVHVTEICDYGIPTYVLPWSSLFDADTFVKELHNVANFLGVTFTPSDTFKQTHHKFLELHKHAI